MRAVVDWVQRQPNIQLWQQVFTIDLLAHEGICRGAVTWNPQHGKMMVWAKQTILCTGGAGQVYRETTNPAVATGDGHGHGLSRRRGTARHGVHAVPSHGALHRRQQPQPDHRGDARRGGLSGRRERPPLHVRLRRAGRTGSARRGVAVDRHADGEDAASQRLPRPEPPAPAQIRERFPGHRRTCREFRTGHHPRSDSRCGPGPTT